MTDFKSGDVVDGRFELRERIGLGGMAAVWRAADLRDSNVEVAVKILREDFLKRNPKEAENNVRRFRREAEILKLLAGARHVVGLRTSGETAAGDHYLVMDLLLGAPLRAKVPRAGRRLGLRSFAWLSRGLVAGLREIHAKNVIHRDLSPDNIFVLEDEQGLPLVKFLDFGIGKGADAKLDQVTKLVTIMGKPQYFSPEQARGGELTSASDVFSLGVILYELASGELPLDLRALPLVAAVKRIVNDPPKDLAAHKEGARLPPQLRGAIMRCMAKKAEERPTLEALAAELEQFSARLDQGEEFGEGSDVSREATRESGIVGYESTPWTEAENASSVAPMPRREFKEGESIGRFEVKRRLGRGGMGEVYRAWDSVLHRDVAIKVASRVEGREAQESLQREARASSRLRSDHIVAVYDAGVASGLPYIVMEYVEGRTLDDIIEEEGPLVGEAFWSYAAGIVEGLSVAHENEPKVVHKDMKPANILVAGSVAKIADFGIASLTAAGQKGEQVLTGAAHGTVNFMSPEQAEGGRVVDERSDLYSLGCVFYMMTTGRPPFEGNEVAILYQHQAQTPVAPSARNPDLVPLELDRVILKCLEKDPADRYQSARELQADLDRLFRPETTTLLRPWYRRTSTFVAVATALAAIVMALVVLKSKDDVRTLDIRKVADRSFEKGTEARYVVKDDVLSCAYEARSAGEVEARVYRGDETTPESVRVFAVERTDRATIDVPLLKERPTETETSELRVELERVDLRGDPVVVRVVRDLKPPKTTLRAYGVDHEGGGEPIALLRYADARVVVSDAGGFPGRPGSTSFEIADDWSVVRVSDQALTLFAAPRDDGEGLRLHAKAFDFSGRESETTFVAVPATLVLEPTQEEGTESSGATTTFRARVSTDPPIPGFDPARDLSDVVIEAVAVGATAAAAAPVAATFADGVLSAVVPTPDASKGPVAYALVVRKGREPLRVAVKKADGSLKRGAPTYVRDATPPSIFVHVDGGAAPAASTESAVSPNGAGDVSVVLRGPGAARDRLTIRAKDVGVDGTPRDVVFLSASIDGGPETPWAADASGAAKPATDFEIPCRLVLKARDAAGNERGFVVRLERRLERIAAARATIGARTVEAATSRPIYVGKAEVRFAVEAENLDGGRGLFVAVDDGAEAAPPPTPMRAVDGRFEAVVDLRTRGAPRCRRSASIYAGRGGVVEQEPLATYVFEFDAVAPTVVVETTDGARVACGGERAAPWAESLVVKIRDDDGGSGLDAATVEAPATIDGGATAQPEGAPVEGAPEIVVRVDATVDPDGAETERRATLRAVDRAGNEAAPCVVVLKTRPKAATIAAVAGDPAFGVGGAAALEGRRLVSPRSTVRVLAAANAATPGFQVVAATYVTRGEKSGETRETPILSLDAATPEGGVETLLDLPVAGAEVVDGRTAFMYRERATGRTAPRPFHEVLWRVDQKKPEVRVTYRGAPVDAETLARGLRVASASEVVVEATDDGGFDPKDEGPGPSFEAVQRSEDRASWRLRDDGVGGRRDVRLSIRDAAGNETTLAFSIDSAKTAPEVASATIKTGAALGPDGSWIPGPTLKIDVANDTVDAVGAQARVRPSGGGAAFEPDFVKLARGGVTQVDVAWDAPKGGDFEIELFHYLEGKGRAAAPFWTRRVRVDAEAPALEILRRGSAVSGEDAGVVASVDEIEFVATDALSGVDPGSREVRQLAPSRQLLPTSKHKGGDDSRATFALSIGKYAGPASFEFSVRDKAGNRAARVVRCVVEDPSSAAAAAGAPRRLSDMSAAEIAAERARIKELSGVDLLPVGDAANPSYFFSKTEVTAEQMRRFEAAYASDPKPVQDFLRALGRAQPQPSHMAYTRPRQDDAPVLGVSEPLATAFCAWVGGVIPTYDEWRAAAGRAKAPSEVFPLRSDGSRDSRDRDFAWFDADAPRPVSLLTDGLFGLRGMAGNAAEWTRFSDSDRRVGVCGGSFKAKSSDFAECLLKATPDSNTIFSVKGTEGVRVRWPALR